MTTVCLLAVAFGDGNFEDTRCRCVCPNTGYFVANDTKSADNHRRYYTQTNVGADMCNAQHVVRREVSTIIDEARVDAFLANCECRYESRNTVMIKVAVLFVLALLTILVVYMGYLTFVDPMLRKKRQTAAAAGFNYRQQSDEIETNIFASNQPAPSTSEEEPSGRQRPRTGSNVLEHVEAKQSKWMKTVEEQRRNIFTDHTMLN